MDELLSFRRKLFLKAWIILCMLLNAVTPQCTEGWPSPCQIEKLLQQLQYPEERYQMHAAALRNQLLDLLENVENENYQQNLNAYEDNRLEDEKRSLSSLARNGMSQYGKRYLGSLARSGMLNPSPYDTKRSIATLAKNGQLPSKEPDVDDADTQIIETKRNLASLARSGYASGKRNIAALARDFELPSYGKKSVLPPFRYGIPPMATSDRHVIIMPRPHPAYPGKRNIGAIARDWSLPNHPPKMQDFDNNFETIKRNIGSLRNSPVHGTRMKRSLTYSMENYNDDGSIEIPEPVYQTSPVDYDELKDVMNHIYPNYENTIHDDKRFLGPFGSQESLPINKRNIGSLARLGLLRSDYSSYSARNSKKSYRQQEQKRHIGALARSGWLPSFRPIRSGRFSRSGRARSRTVGYYPQPERLRQPIAAVCRRCEDIQLQNNFSWGAPGLQSTWGTPPRLTALHWRSLRPTGNFY